MIKVPKNIHTGHKEYHQHTLNSDYFRILQYDLKASPRRLKFGDNWGSQLSKKINTYLFFKRIKQAYIKLLEYPDQSYEKFMDCAQEVGQI